MPGQSGYPYAREKRTKGEDGDVGTTDGVLRLARKNLLLEGGWFLGWFATRRGGALEAGGLVFGRGGLLVNAPNPKKHSLLPLLRGKRCDGGQC